MSLQPVILYSGWQQVQVQLWRHQPANYLLDLVCTHIHEIAAKVSSITVFLRSDVVATIFSLYFLVRLQFKGGI